jgi:hypothetical protein
LARATRIFRGGDLRVFHFRRLQAAHIRAASGISSVDFACTFARAGESPRATASAIGAFRASARE